MKKKVKIGLLHTTIRLDEKLLIAEGEKQRVEIDVRDVREAIFDPHNATDDYDVVLERCVSTVKGTHALEFFESRGIPTVNTLAVAHVCENKFATSLALERQKVPTPRFTLVFNESKAKEAIEQMGGFPVVLKPISGSWGRMVARVNDADALEALIEQKTILGGPHQHAFYIQQYIQKPGRDIRIVVIGEEVVAAIYRTSDHWVTNTIRGAKPIACQISSDLAHIARQAAHAIGGGILGIDIFEGKDGYVVNEINHTMEFKNVQMATGVNVAEKIIQYCQNVA